MTDRREFSGIPALNEPVKIVKLERGSSSLASVMPNRTPGAVQRYLNFLLPRWHVSDGNRGVFTISRRTE